MAWSRNRWVRFKVNLAGAVPMDRDWRDEYQESGEIMTLRPAVKELQFLLNQRLRNPGSRGKLTSEVIIDQI
jgi:1-acyl-sn-glycerol-3-phosphate acyltransferase